MSDGIVTMQERVVELEERRSKAMEMGGEKRVSRQHARGKMTARERIDSLVDEGSFQELGIHGSEYSHPLLAADGVITGTSCDRIISRPRFS